MSKANGKRSSQTMDCIEMGVTDGDNMCKPDFDFEATNGLLSDCAKPNHDDKTTEKKEKVADKPPADPNSLFADIPWDDEDWQSEDEEVDEIGKKRAAFKENSNIFTKAVVFIQYIVLGSNYAVNRMTKGYFWTAFWLVAYFVYFGLALNYKFGDEDSLRLLICTIIGVICFTRNYIHSGICFLFRKINGGEQLSPRSGKAWALFKNIVQWTMNILLLVLVIYSLVEEGMKDTRNLRSVPGLFFFLLVCLLFSNNPAKIDWYVIYWSMGLQFLLSLGTLRGKWGRDAVAWGQERFDEFFGNAKAGSLLLFGQSYKDHEMIFSALPLVFLTNATLVVLYYLGAMQLIIKWIGVCINRVLKTSPIECISVAGGIFLEGGIMALSLRPFLGTMTQSELFVLVTSGLASLGGTYVAVLATYGVSLKFIIPAMLVSAPATFAVCKLMVPERVESKRKNKGSDTDWDMGNIEKERYSSILEALQGGAVSIVGLFANIVVVAYVFFSYISWVNNTLQWFGERVGVEKLSIELIFSYLLYPVAMAMGVEFEDCRRVAMLLGYRIGSTNIIAFFKLSELKMNKFYYDKYMLETNFTGPITTDRDDITLELWNKTLEYGFLNDRSEMIITYCLVGFSSVISIGIFMSYLYILVPRRRKWLTRHFFLALVAGNVANCMTGCFAGLFY